MNNVSNRLYSDLADVYEMIADDRDFASECEWIWNAYHALQGDKPKNILELFAGPAYHAKQFRAQYQAPVCAIDNSQAMKHRALLSGTLNEEEFIVGDLPNILQKNPALQKYDICLILRYSLGLIDYSAAEKLFRHLKNCLNPGALIFIELHNVQLLVNQFDGLDIKSREKYDIEKKRSIRCEWPSGPIQWDDEGWKVLMPLTIEIKNAVGEITRHQTVSEEHIYRAEDIMRMTTSLGFLRVKSSIELNPYSSRWVILQNEHKTGK